MPFMRAILARGLGHFGCNDNDMARIVISYVLAGMALVMLVGGLTLLVHALKSLVKERESDPKDALPPQNRSNIEPRNPRIPSTSSVKSAAQ